MTALSIPAYRWDAANRVPLPEAVLFLHCTEGHQVPLTHQNWHLVEESRCDICGCLVDVFHARRHALCPCDAPSSGLEDPRAAEEPPKGKLEVSRSNVLLFPRPAHAWPSPTRPLRAAGRRP